MGVPVALKDLPTRRPACRALTAGSRVDVADRVPGSASLRSGTAARGVPSSSAKRARQSSRSARTTRSHPTPRNPGDRIRLHRHERYLSGGSVGRIGGRSSPPGCAALPLAPTPADRCASLQHCAASPASRPRRAACRADGVFPRSRRRSTARAGSPIASTISRGSLAAAASGANRRRRHTCCRCTKYSTRAGRAFLRRSGDRCRAGIRAAAQRRLAAAGARIVPITPLRRSPISTPRAWRLPVRRARRVSRPRTRNGQPFANGPCRRRADRTHGLTPPA